jgi:hypothetical protein
MNATRHDGSGGKAESVFQAGKAAHFVFVFYIRVRESWGVAEVPFDAMQVWLRYGLVETL